jgi:hypothetical protein
VRQRLPALGCRLRRLRQHHLKATPAAQAACVAELAALLAEWAEDGDGSWVDAATIRRHPTLTAPWCVVDEVPAVPTGDDHPQVPVDGAVAPLTGRPHDHVSPTLGKGAVATWRQPLRTEDQQGI